MDEQGAQPPAKRMQAPAVYDLTAESIISRIEANGKVDSVARSLMTVMLEKLYVIS